MSHFHFLAPVFATLLVLPLVAQNRLTPEILWRLGRVAEPRVSPDGKRVLYTVRSYDIPANSGRSQVQMLDLKSHIGIRQLFTKES